MSTPTQIIHIFRALDLATQKFFLFSSLIFIMVGSAVLFILSLRCCMHRPQPTVLYARKGGPKTRLHMNLHATLHGGCTLDVISSFYLFIFSAKF